MTRRDRIGARRHRATFTQHNGTQDDHGQPTYTTPGDWDTVVQSWPCEVLTVSGGERIRGRQVAGETTHVLFGEYYGGKDATDNMRVTVDGVTYDVVTAYDPAGDHREWRVEAKRETD